MKKAVVHWRSKITGFVSHGSPISVEAANYAARMGDRNYPELTHWVVKS